jgi:hypothetical protein
MNILSIEKAKTELSNFLEYSSSRRLKLKKISEFFGFLLDGNSPNLAESYLIELLPQYVEYLKTYSPFGVEPGFTQSIIDTNEKLLGMNANMALSEINEQLASLNDGMNEKLQLLLKILDGDALPSTEPKVMFPVVEECEQRDNDFVLGAVDSLTIKVSKAKLGDKFIIVPSESEKDKRLEEQIKTSWMNAKEYCKKHVKKISEHHEVIISFDEHLGIYKGDSVGTALVIAYIEELLRFYNSQTILEPIAGTAFTGGVREDGEINQISKEIIEKKVEIAFYTSCKMLVVPDEDITFAINKLSELKKQHAKRNLRLVGVKDIDEILLRRDLVEIKKQKLVVRTGKLVRKNWAGALFAIILTAILTYIFALDFDDNPATFEANKSQLIVKNKNGKILWVQKSTLPEDADVNPKILAERGKVVDINADGENEVLIIGAKENDYPRIDTGGKLCCYDKNAKFLWEYIFSDSVESHREILKPFYGLKMIDTLSINGRKSIWLISSNVDSYSSAIFNVDVKTGKRQSGTLWCSGFVIEAGIKDLDADGKAEILAAGVDNGYEDVVIFSFIPDTLTSSRLSTKDYMIKNFPIANVTHYIRLPKTDFENYIGKRMSGVRAGTFFDKQNEKKYNFTVGGFYNEKPYGYWAKLDYNLKDFDFVIDNEFRVYRDSLVAQGKLNLPYTDTEEYKQILRNKILYLKDGKWVKREELE